MRRKREEMGNMKEEQKAYFEKGMRTYGMNSKKRMKECIAYLAEELEKEKENCDRLLKAGEGLYKVIEEKEKEIYELRDSLERQMKEYGLAIAGEKGTCKVCGKRLTPDCPRAYEQKGNGKYVMAERLRNDQGYCEQFQRGRTGNGQAEV